MQIYFDEMKRQNFQGKPMFPNFPLLTRKLETEKDDKISLLKSNFFIRSMFQRNKISSNFHYVAVGDTFQSIRIHTDVKYP